MKLFASLIILVVLGVSAAAFGEGGGMPSKSGSAAKMQLTQHQIEALDAYEALRAERPALFSGRHDRPIVLKREELAAYAAEHGVVLGVAVDTPYVLFINDLVESRLPNGGVKRHPYLRIVSRGQLKGGVNTVVLATIEDPSLGERGAVVLVDQERHALGAREIELPRGFGEPGLTGEANALRELEQETGYVGEHAYLLGSTNTDSGLTDSVVSFYHVPVVRQTPRHPETEEAVRRVILASRQEIWNKIRLGEIRDSFTLQALALLGTQSSPSLPKQ